MEEPKDDPAQTETAPDAIAAPSSSKPDPRPAQATWHLWLLVLLLMAATILCDRVTKRIAVDHLAGAPRASYWADTFRLDYTENTGAFLGLGAHWPVWARTAAFSVGTGAILIALLFMAARYRMEGRALLGFGFIWAGGASNLADRIAHGYVVDFMNVGIGPLRTGIFNVADMAILLGIALVLIHLHTTQKD
ncbi:MAG: signal peptidase II [Vicinamibacteria bacterium]|jgi:signal peptidase II|nr:signal peptidase II [Vicinamibacteria bacterium]